MFTGRNLDLLMADGEVKLVLERIKVYRSNIDTCHSDWFNIAKEWAASFNVEAIKPRTSSRSQYRANTPSDSATEKGLQKDCYDPDAWCVLLITFIAN